LSAVAAPKANSYDFVEPNDTEALPACHAGWHLGVYSGRGFLAIVVRGELNG